MWSLVHAADVLRGKTWSLAVIAAITAKGIALLKKRGFSWTADLVLLPCILPDSSWGSLGTVMSSGINTFFIKHFRRFLELFENLPKGLETFLCWKHLNLQLPLRGHTPGGSSSNPLAAS